MANRRGNSGNSERFYFGGFQNTGDFSLEIKRHLLLGRKAMTKLNSILKSRDLTSPAKVHLIQRYGFSSSHVWMRELGCKERGALKNCCF